MSHPVIAKALAAAAPARTAATGALQAGARVVEPLAQVNPHLLLAGALSAAAVIMLAGTVVFGDPERAHGRVVAQITRVTLASPLPAAEPATETREVAAAEPEPAPELIDADALFALRPDEGGATDPRLPGVTDLPQQRLAARAAPAPRPDAGEANEDGPAPSPRGLDSLAKAPLAGLTQPGPGGPLPAVGEGGRTPAEAYSRPFRPEPDAPWIALIVTGLGLNAEATQNAIDALPAEVTLAFAPYADDLQTWVDKARADGHEVMLELPMEPYDYPANDTGPYTLLAEADVSENLRRLDWLMARAAGYFAVINYRGARFTASDAALSPVVRTLKSRGIMLVYDGDTKRSALARVTQRHGVPYAAADRILDATPTADAIDDQLLELEALAIQDGASMGAASALPVTLDQVGAWTRTVELKGYQLAPASAVVKLRAVRARQAGGGAVAAQAARTELPAFSRVEAGFGQRGEEADGSSGGGGY